MKENISFKEFYPALCGIEQKISTVEQYIRAVDYAYKILTAEQDEIKFNQKLWFRGIKNSDYALLPSIGRQGFNVEYELMYLSKFKAKALSYLEGINMNLADSGIESYWNWLFLMHYHRAPTRLLEWTEDALVALVFAVDQDVTADEKEKDAAVWCLNPVVLNTAFTFHEYYPAGYIPNVYEKGVYEMFGPFRNTFKNERPAAVYGPMNNISMIIQRVAFTVFPYTMPLADMRNLSDSSKYLYKIIIDKDAKESIADQLRRFGITKNRLMSKLSSLAQEITEEE
ncbi:MAG: FRG domain-containing protein [Clostridiaceae bacterium]|nr:FRG domain-containing protein [Clostridiaceae bacterium]